VPEPAQERLVAAVVVLHGFEQLVTGQLSWVSEGLAQYVAVARRQWAGKNPRAMRRDILNVEDMLASRMVAYSSHLLERCLVTDGGGALVVTSADRAADFPQSPVHVLGTGEASETPDDLPDDRLHRVADVQKAGRTAFAEGGHHHRRRQPPDDLRRVRARAHLRTGGAGLRQEGEAGPFIAEGNTESGGGSLPLNTNGGGLSYTHTGMYGMFAIQEGVRQIRGEAAAQVASPDISVVLGNGGTFATCGVLVLGKSPRPWPAASTAA
jgi:acetyl-CoA acetyltransferase